MGSAARGTGAGNKGHRECCHRGRDYVHDSTREENDRPPRHEVRVLNCVLNMSICANRLVLPRQASLPTGLLKRRTI